MRHTWWLIAAYHQLVEVFVGRALPVRVGCQAGIRFGVRLIDRQPCCARGAVIALNHPMLVGAVGIAHTGLHGQAHHGLHPCRGGSALSRAAHEAGVTGNAQGIRQPGGGKGGKERAGSTVAAVLAPHDGVHQHITPAINAIQPCHHVAALAVRSAGTVVTL